MISVKTIAKNWDGFFFEEVSPSTLDIYRIFFGILNLLNIASLLPDAVEWFGVGAHSTLPLATAQTLYSGYRINLFNFLAPTDFSMWLILGIYLLVSITITIGYKSRLSAITLFITLVSIQNRNFMILNSGDTVLKCIAFVMLFAPIGKMFSVDAWLAKRNGTYIPNETIPITTIRLMQLQFSLVYLATFWFKSYGDLWVDGTATYYTARLISFQRYVIPFVFDNMDAVRMMTWSALFIEFALGTLIWIKELRYPIVIAGVLLHVGIELTMSIGFFEWMMLFTFILFIEPRHMDQFLRMTKKKLFQITSKIQESKVLEKGYQSLLNFRMPHE